MYTGYINTSEIYTNSGKKISNYRQKHKTPPQKIHSAVIPAIKNFNAGRNTSSWLNQWYLDSTL